MSVKSKNNLREVGGGHLAVAQPNQTHMAPARLSRTGGEPTYFDPAPPARTRKRRSEYKLGRLTEAQRELLVAWFAQENLDYATAALRVRAQFGLSVSPKTLSLFWSEVVSPRLARRPASNLAARFLVELYADGTVQARPFELAEDRARMPQDDLLHLTAPESARDACATPLQANAAALKSSSRRRKGVG